MPRFLVSIYALYKFVCACVCAQTQGGADAQDALGYRSFSAKEPLIKGSLWKTVFKDKASSGGLELQEIFRTRATNYRTLLRKITYKDKASYTSSPPSICVLCASTYFFFHTYTLQVCLCVFVGSVIFALWGGYD